MCFDSTNRITQILWYSEEEVIRTGGKEGIYIRSVSVLQSSDNFK